MKNRILSVFLAALMIMSCFGTLAVSAAEYTEPTVAVECGKIGEGEGVGPNQVKADVVMYNNPGIASCNFSVSFDNTKLNIVGYETQKNEYDEDELVTMLPGAPTFNIDDPAVTDLSKLNKVTIAYAQADNFKRNGKIFSIIFDVVADFEETTLKIVDDDFVNKDSEKVTFAFVDGSCGLDPITGVTLAGAKYEYDGTEKSLAVSGATSDMTVTYEPKSVKNVGKHEIVATVKKAGLATLTLKATLEITPKNLTIEGVKVTDKVFDNTTAATVDYSAAALKGVCAGDTVTFTKPTATFADVNVGTGKTMVMDAIKLEGASASNYTLTQPTIKGVIIQREIKIIPNPGQGKKVDTEDGVIEYTVEGDTLGFTFTGALSRVAGEDAGEISKTYPITIGTLALNDNFKLVLADEVYTIYNKDPQDVTVEVPASAIYGTTGLKATVDVVTGPANPVIKFASSDENVVKVDADGNITTVGVGKATITVTVDGDATYAKYTAVKEIEVKGIPVTVTPTSGLTFVYGSVGTITYTADVTGVTFTGALALDNTDAGTRNVVIGTLAAANYEITLAPATVTITKKTVTLTGVELWPTETPEVNMNTFEPDVAGAVAGDDVYVVTGTVGVTKTAGVCTVTGLTLGGADAANYTLDTTVAHNYTNAQDAVDKVVDFVEADTTIVDTGSDMNVNDMIDTVLPEGATVEVEADVAGIIDENGNIVRPADDTVVTFTFTVTVNGASSTFTKTVTITAASNTDRLLALMYYYYMMGLNKKDTVSAVKSNIASGEVVKGTAVTLTTETAGATIYYTTDGKTPTTASTVYTAPIVIEGNVTIKAIAVKAGMRNSGVVTFTYKAVDAKTTIALKKDAATIKYLAGYADGTFKPNQAATRYEVIVALNNVFDITTNGTPLAMKDVAADKKAVVDLFTAAGIIDGFPGGEFKGNDGITRAQFAKIAAVMLGLDIKNAKDAGFKDVSGWAAPYINACAAAELVIGTGDGNFEPTKNITRAELATFINRITGAKAGTECSYKDVLADAWYFGQVAAAAK